MPPRTTATFEAFLTRRPPLYNAIRALDTTVSAFRNGRFTPMRKARCQRAALSQANWSSSAFASLMISVSRPSVNQA